VVSPLVGKDLKDLLGFLAFHLTLHLDVEVYGIDPRERENESISLSSFP